MRVQEIVLSEAIPHDAMRSQRFYHGTTKDKFEAVLAHGIQPPDFAVDGRTRNSGFRPVEGKIYLTPHLKYARLYGPYVFVITGDQLVDVQPDEDCVGEAYYLIANRFPHAAETVGMTERLQQAGSEPLYQFMKLFKSVCSERTRMYVEGGDNLWFAKAGKAVVKKMPDWMKLWMIEMGSHVAHNGPVVPAECWYNSSEAYKQLLPDRSNFFEVSERIR